MVEFGQPAPVAGAQRFEKPAQPAVAGAGPKAGPWERVELPQAQKQAIQAAAPKWGAQRQPVPQAPFNPMGFNRPEMGGFQDWRFRQPQMNPGMPMGNVMPNPWGQQQVAPMMQPMMQNPWAAWGGFGGGFRGMLGAGMMNPGMRWF